MLEIARIIERRFKEVTQKRHKHAKLVTKKNQLKLDISDGSCLTYQFKMEMQFAFYKHGVPILHLFPSCKCIIKQQVPVRLSIMGHNTILIILGLQA